MLLHVSKRAEARPDFAHRLDVEWLESAEGIGSEVQDAAASPARSLELLIAQEYGAGDDPRLELEQHDRAGHRIQTCALIAPAAVSLVRQIAKEDAALHVFDCPATKAGELV